jgi:hypothetical protein
MVAWARKPCDGLPRLLLLQWGRQPAALGLAIAKRGIRYGATIAVLTLAGSRPPAPQR